MNEYPAIQNFLQSLQFEKKYSQHTLSSYRIDLAQFAAYLNAEYEGPEIQDIKTAFIRSWLADLKGNEALTNKSINRKISTLKSFFKYTLKQGLIEQLPTAGIVPPKINKRLPVFVDEKDIRKVFENISFPDTHTGRTEKLMLSLFYNTGMRLSELINLKENNIDVAYSHIKVLGKGNKERIIPVAKDLLANLQTYLSTRPAAENVSNVFTTEKGKPFNPKTVYNFVKKYLGAATTVEKRGPHVLRHTFATHLMNNGAELNAVKELLGHASLASTQVYTHLTIEKLKEVYKQAHPKA